MAGNKDDELPVSGRSLSRDGKKFVTCKFAQVWDMDYYSEPPCTLVGHKERLTDVTYSPSEEHITTAVDRTAKLWKTKENGGWSFVKTFGGHHGSLSRIAFHPSGKFLGTTSLDKTWRLWDIVTGEELLRLEGGGHDSKMVAFRCGGSLAVSCGMDGAVARGWDLRTGRSICAFKGLDQPILDINFSPNGYHLATGGQDNTCLIWELGKGKSFHKISAHSDFISQVKFGPQEGCYLFTGSHDKTVKMESL